MGVKEIIDILEDIIETFRGDEDYKDWIEACREAIKCIKVVHNL